MKQGITMIGLEQMKSDIGQLKQEVQNNVLRIVENAAARAIKGVVQAAANSVHRVSGDLAESIKTITVRNKNLTGRNRVRIYVGPEKKKGYHGFFIDQGWQRTTGKNQTFSTRRGRTFTTRRRARPATGNTHSQRGLEQIHKISGNQWFTKSIPAAESAGRQAGEAAYARQMKKLNKQGLL